VPSARYAWPWGAAVEPPLGGRLAVGQVQIATSPGPTRPPTLPGEDPNLGMGGITCRRVGMRARATWELSKNVVQNIAGERGVSECPEVALAVGDGPAGGDEKDRRSSGPAPNDRTA